MKTLLFERFDNFQAAPFTVQRLCELLTDPKKHYSRLDKFMRALEKNILGECECYSANYTQFQVDLMLIFFAKWSLFILLVVSTVEPGRKPLENDDDDHLPPNGDIMSDIMNEIEITKNENKLSTNGTTEKHNNNGNAIESVAKAEIASSSGISTVTSTDVEVKLTEADTKDVSDQVSIEKPIESTAEAQSSSVTSAESEPQPSKDEEMAEIPKSSVDETVETKPAPESVESVVVDEAKKPEEIDTTTPEKPKSEEIPEKIEEKSDNIDIDTKPEIESEVKGTVVSTEEKSAVDAATEVAPMAEAVKGTPPTPKHARSTSDEEDDGDDDGDSKNPCAKKIRLDLDASEIEKPEIESTLVSEVDLQKEVDILDSMSAEIDAQKESELLEEVIIHSSV